MIQTAAWLNGREGAQHVNFTLGERITGDAFLCVLVSPEIAFNNNILH